MFRRIGSPDNGRCKEYGAVLFLILNFKNEISFLLQSLVLAELSLDKLHNFHDWNYQYAKADGNQVFFQAYAGKLECVCKYLNFANESSSN